MDSSLFPKFKEEEFITKFSYFGGTLSVKERLNSGPCSLEEFSLEASTKLQVSSRLTYGLILWFNRYANLLHSDTLSTLIFEKREHNPATLAALFAVGGREDLISALSLEHRKEPSWPLFEKLPSHYPNTHFLRFGIICPNFPCTKEADSHYLLPETTFLRRCPEIRERLESLSSPVNS